MAKKKRKKRGPNRRDVDRPIARNRRKMEGTPVRRKQHDSKPKSKRRAPAVRKPRRKEKPTRRRQPTRKPIPERKKKAPKRRRPQRKRKPIARKLRLLAFLLSFLYSPKKKGKDVRADFIVAGKASLADRDPVEVFGELISKVIQELPVTERWIARIAEHAFIEGDGEVDSSIERSTKPPKKAKIRSAYRGDELLYGSNTSEE